MPHAATRSKLLSFPRKAGASPSRCLMKCYDEAAESFGWMRRNPQPGSMREDDWLIGWGCTTALYPTHIGPHTVLVRLLSAGDVTVQTAAHEIGNGAYTVIGQMAAERLGVPLGSVTVELGYSRLPPAPVAGGSNTTASTCLYPLARHPSQFSGLCRRRQSRGGLSPIYEYPTSARQSGGGPSTSHRDPSCLFGVVPISPVSTLPARFPLHSID